MPKFGIVENNLIINAIVADEEFINEFYPEAILIPDHINTGDSYIDGEFIRHLGTPAEDDLEA